MLGTSGGNKPRFLLVYGSATGQAQAICEEIAEKADSFGLRADLHSLEHTGKKFNIEEEKCVVIVTSTSGDGDPPPNADKFMRRIKKRVLASTYLAHMNYALLGLGDSNYSNFCRCGRDMDKRLQELGARQFYPTGLADDGVGLEVVADPWLDGLYPALQKFLGANPQSSAPVSETVPPRDSHPAPPRGENDSRGIAEHALNGEVAVNGSADSHDDGNLTSSVKDLTLNNEDQSHGNVKVAKNLSTNSCDSKVSDHNSITDKVDKNSDSVTLVSQQQSSNSTDTNSADDSKTKEVSDNQVQEIMKENSDFLKNLHVRETPCVRVPSQTPAPPWLVNPEPELEDRSLTIPVVPPHYLVLAPHDSLPLISSLPYQNGCKLPSAASQVSWVQISEAKVLTHPEAVKKTLCLCLDIKDSGFVYSPGDSVSVICPNHSSEVNLLLDRLGVSASEADRAIKLSVLADTKKRRAAVPAHVHEVSTLRHILTTCVNIRETPSKACIRSLIEYTSDPGEVRRLQELCSKEGAQLYTRVIREQHVSLLDLLYAFPSCIPPVERILELLPRLQPRPYSACSFQETSSSHLRIVFNVVDIPGVLYHRRGLCTGWLDDLTRPLQTGGAETVQIPVFMRTNQHFRPPDNLSRPVVMIGPGTGVAPFLGFLQQRAAKRRELSDPKTYGDTWLFFGCRHKDKDFLFREELEQFEQDGTLTNLCVTFSRDPSPPPGSSAVPRRYVQHLMRGLGSDLAQLLDQEALVYVCGDAKNMAKDVASALEDVLMEHKGLSREDANMYIMKKRINKTYFEDVWV